MYVNEKMSQVPVAEIRRIRFKASPDKWFTRPYLKKKKKNHKKRAGGVAQGVGPEFKPSSAKKEKRYVLKLLGGVGIKENGRGVNSSIYLIHCKNFCKCHKVPPAQQ
jgi:hypothetical protein